jgi:hypothetical protein
MGFITIVKLIFKNQLLFMCMEEVGVLEINQVKLKKK